MEPPRVNPIGILETEPDFVSSPRRYSPRLRLLAGLLLALFFAATVVTTVVSLGRYCLTTDAADTRVLNTRVLSGPSRRP
jgi:hypothetical protein